MGKYIDIETHVRPNDSMSIMTIEDMLKKYTDGYSKEAQVELVRCHECIYYKGGVYNYCYIHGTRDMKPDGYCSRGERK